MAIGTATVAGTGVLIGGLARRALLRANAAPAVPVVIDDNGVTRKLSSHRVERVRWDELIEVAVMTTADGPWADDVFYVLGAEGHGCVVPESFADEAFVDRLLSLPGFDHDTFVEAMGSTSEATYVCWRASGSAATR